MGDAVADLPDGTFWPVDSPARTHLTNGSGWTLCGRDCAAWERREETAHAEQALWNP